MPAKPVPDGFHAITPYLVVEGIPRLLGFLAEAFGAVPVGKVPGEEESPRHAEVRIGDSIVMMGEASERFPAMPAVLYHYCEDVDAVHARAVAAGGAPIMPPTDMFYGDRCGAVKDPSGNQWWIATRREDLTPEEIARRAAEQG